MIHRFIILFAALQSSWTKVLLINITIDGRLLVGFFIIAQHQLHPKPAEVVAIYKTKPLSSSCVGGVFIIFIVTILKLMVYMDSLYWQKIIVSLFTTFNKPQYSAVLYLLSIYQDKRHMATTKKKITINPQVLYAPWMTIRKFHFDCSSCCHFCPTHSGGG